MNYPDSVRFLYGLGNEIQTAKLGLDRIRLLLEALGSPHRRGCFAHVAGTNGKGSTAAMIEAGLRAHGLRTGLFTSPHLMDPTERIRIDGRPVSREEFAESFDLVHEAAERLLRQGAIDLHPTYFETVTAMALELFDRRAVECAVMEVGLGGRLDATNVIAPRVAVITPVDFDHEVLLGRSLESIAAEKAGILKPGVPAVFARQRGEAARVLEDAAHSAGVSVRRTSEWVFEELDLRPDGCSFRARGPAEFVIECPLAGEHQADNALTAAAALDTLGVPAAAIRAGIRGVRWPGRLQRVWDCPGLILDGAHNPAGARALAAYIDRFHAGRRVWMIYGAMRDKALAEVGGILFQRADRLILTAPGQARAARPESLLEMSGHPAAEARPNVAAALATYRAGAAPGDIAFVTGSLFLVGEALLHVA